tara:strand:+ start:101 stop:451 length:351 start_codon:yes stop_codon:yes gene_type:complete
MFSAQPFSTVSFSDGEMFLDALTSTNVVTSAITSLIPVSKVIVTATALDMALVTQSLGANTITVAIPESSTVLSGTLSFTIQTPSVFTYNEVNDNVTEETWSSVTTTTTVETWSKV